jgi:osmoprotectant transport system permease protein
VGFLRDVVAWFADGSHWQGTFGIPNRLWEHVTLSVAAVLAALAVAFPIAFWLGHLRRAAALATNAGNITRAIPSIAVLLIVVQQVGLASWPVVGSVPAFVSLWALAIAPILTNTYVAVADVPDSVRESAVAMGMTGWQRAVRVELPLALPLTLAGLRTATVQVIATATLAAQVGSGGLGRYIIDGIAVRQFPQVFAGSLLVALLAVLAEVSFALGTRPLSHRRLG